MNMEWDIQAGSRGDGGGSENDSHTRIDVG